MIAEGVHRASWRLQLYFFELNEIVHESMKNPFAFLFNFLKDR